MCIIGYNRLALEITESGNVVGKATIVNKRVNPGKLEHFEVLLWQYSDSLEVSESSYVYS